VHRTWPGAHRPVALDVEVRLGIVDDFSEARELASVAWCTSDVLQPEHTLDDLGDGLLREHRSGAVVEARAVEVVRREWAARIHGRWVREVIRLIRIL
jgi:hypothetical protein